MGSLTDLYDTLFEGVETLRRINQTLVQQVAQPQPKETTADIITEALVAKVIRALATNPRLDDETLDLLIEAHVRRMFE